MPQKHTETTGRDELLDQVLGRYFERVEAGESPDPQSVIEQHPELAAELRSFFVDLERVDRAAEPLRPASGAGSTAHAALAAGSTRPKQVLPGAAGDSHLEDASGTLKQFGDYERLEEIWRGGMGAVFRAWQRGLNRPVAIKMILAGQFASDADVRRFYNEAEAVAKLDHPNIVPIYEVGEHDGVPFFSMKLMEGGSLSDRLDQFRDDPRAAARLVVTVAGAVHHAHQRGILHRDLKPSNVLLTLECGDESPLGNTSLASVEAIALPGEPASSRRSAKAATSRLAPKFVPFVADFGLAKRIEPGRDVTQTGAIIGTPSYMAPEQAAAGEVHGRRPAVTTASDVYGLGAILYALLTGGPPFRGESVLETLELVRTQPPRPPSQSNPHIDRDLETICLKCLEKEPARRYSSPVELGADLNRWLGGEPIEARPVGRGERAWRWCRRNPIVASSIAVAALLLVALVAVQTHSERRARAALATETKANREIAAALEAVDAEQKRTAVALASERRTSYYHSVALASQAYDGRHLERANRFLDESPAEHRGWEWHYLRRHCQSHRARLAGHTMQISSVAFSPDGRLLASSSHDRTVRLWDVESHECVRVLRGHEMWVQQVAFSPDGRRLATMGYDKSVRLWDTESGDELRRIDTGLGGSIAFSPDGRELAGTDAELKAVRLWDAATGEQTGVLPMPQIVTGVAYSPDGSCIAAVSQGVFFTIWDARSREQLKSWQSSTGVGLQIVRRIEFSADGSKVLAAGPHEFVTSWDVATGKLLSELKGHTAAVRGATFCTSGDHVISASDDRTYRVWDIGQKLQVYVFPAHDGSVTCVAASPLGKLLATGGDDGIVKIWDAHRPAEPWLDPRYRVTRGGPVQFSPDGETVFAGSGVAVHVFAAIDGNKLDEYQYNNEKTTTNVRFSADGRLLATAGPSGAVQVFDWPSRALLRSLEGHVGTVHHVAFNSQTGAPMRLATIDEDRTVRVWDPATGELVRRVDSGAELLVAVALSPDGKRVAAGGRKGFAKIWDVKTGAEILSLTGHTVTVSRIEFSTASAAPGLIATAGGSDRTVRVWDAATGAERWRLVGHTESVYSVAFHPTEPRLASSAGDGSVKVWDLTSGRELLSFDGLKSSFFDVSFSPDGRRLATSLSPLFIKVWDATPLLADGITADATARP